MKTRQDYLNGKCTHEEYYSQFVTEDIKRKILLTFSKAILIEAYKKDVNFNTLKLDRWDNLVYVIEPGTEGQTCTIKVGLSPIFKEAARQIVEDNDINTDKYENQDN